MSIVSCAVVSANDGAFYANGATLRPMKNTSIRMSREDLSLKREGDICIINVTYSFINEGNDTTVDVGFVTRPPSGDVYDVSTKGRQINDPPIEEMNIVIDNKSVKGKWKRVSYEMKDMPKPKANEEFQEFNGYHVYMFKARFHRGTTVVSHSYRYKMGSNVLDAGDVDYTLTSGKLWKGGTIDTFNLTIDMGDTVIVAVPQGFNNRSHTVQWKTSGDAVFIGNDSLYVTEDSSRLFPMYSIGSGTLSLSLTAFAPDNELLVILYDGRKVIERIEKEGEAVYVKLTPTEKTLARKWIYTRLEWAPSAESDTLEALFRKLK